MAWQPHWNSRTNGKTVQNIKFYSKSKYFLNKFIFLTKTKFPPQFTIVDTPGFGADDILEENRWNFFSSSKFSKTLLFKACWGYGEGVQRRPEVYQCLCHLVQRNWHEARQGDLTNCYFLLLKLILHLEKHSKWWENWCNTFESWLTSFSQMKIDGSKIAV